MNKIKTIESFLIIFAVFLGTSSLMPHTGLIRRANIPKKDGILDETRSLMDNFYIVPPRSVSENHGTHSRESGSRDRRRFQGGNADLFTMAQRDHLVKDLKHGGDNFTSVISPDGKEQFLQNAYGYRVGSGISVIFSEAGVVVKKVERHSPAYSEGIRKNDTLERVNGIRADEISEERLKAALFPSKGEKIGIEFIPEGEGSPRTASFKSAPYFIETVFEKPTGKPGVFCLEVKSFNKKTHSDLEIYIKSFMSEGMETLILDLRNNPGGPPKAVAEISSIFLPPGIPVLSFYKRNSAHFGLITRKKDIFFEGKILIIVNRGTSGSAEMLASGLARVGRATLAGNESMAGRPFLREAFILKDGALLTMITGRAFLPVFTKNDPRNTGSGEPAWKINLPDKDLLPFLVERL